MDYSGFNLDDYVKGLSFEELQARVHSFTQLKAQEEQDPMLRFRANNDKQQEFLGFKKNIQFFIGGNKSGKTATIFYKLCKMMKGTEKNFHHKPPLNIWVCGETKQVIADTPLKQIVKWLRPDEYKIHKIGNLVETMEVYTEFEGKRVTNQITFKPYNASVDVFESANVHAIVADEEVPVDVFRAMIPRIVEHNGWLLNCLTPTHGLTYTGDVIYGNGEFGALFRKGFIDFVKTTTFDNSANLDPNALEMMKAAFENDPREYQIRLLGEHQSFEGKVYKIEKDLFDPITNSYRPWHVFHLKELPEYTELKFFGALDYGRGDNFVFLLIAIDKDNNYWVIGEVYITKLDAREQAKMIKECCEYWGVKPETIVCDNQIENTLPQKDALKQHIRSIKDYYIDELGEDFTVWRCEAMDKRNPHIAREAIADVLRPDKETKMPRLRFSDGFTTKSINELSKLEYAGGVKEKTSGKDDAEAALRYFMAANITYDNFMTMEEFGHADWDDIDKWGEIASY